MKPFDFGELLARVRALQRRPRGVDGATIDRRPARARPGQPRLVTVDDRQLSLTSTEYRILELLLRRSPAVVDRKAIAEHAWADETDPLGSNAIDVQLSRLRAKLPGAGSPDRHGPRRRLPARGVLSGGRRRCRASAGSRSASPSSRRRSSRPRTSRSASASSRSSSATSPTRSTSGSRHRSVRPRRRPRPRRPPYQARRRTGSAARRSSSGPSRSDGTGPHRQHELPPFPPNTPASAGRSPRRSTASISRLAGQAVGDDWVVIGQSLRPVSETAPERRSSRELLIAPFLARGVFLGARRDRPAGRGADRGIAPRASSTSRPDASHELRTPLAVIEAQTSLAARRPARRGLVPGRVRA